MKIETIAVGPLQSNCYVVFDEKSRDAMVIDPGDDAPVILRAVRERDLRLLFLVCTHGHFDHVGVAGKIREATGAQIVLNREDLEIYRRAEGQAAFWGYRMDQPPDPDLFVVEEDYVRVGDLSFMVYHTPGHSPGGICLYGHGVVFTGDTLFAGSVGRTDFHGGSIAELKNSFRRLMGFPPETMVLPGHGGSSTIGQEKVLNFFSAEVREI